MRVKMTFSYDGSDFFGSQSQKSGVKTVMNVLMDVFTSLGISSKIEASGRTDRGVHALRQVISLDLPSYWDDLEKLKRHLNHKALPHIFFEKIEIVKEDFHARYSAKRRQYRYIISTATPSVYFTNYVLYTKPFDAKKISEAVTYFEGVHDFSFFMKADADVAHAIRKLYKARFYRYKNFYIFTFQANGFVRSQIRMMVAFLLQIGYNRLSRANLEDQLKLKYKYSSTLVEPNGLYLSRIWY